MNKKIVFILSLIIQTVVVLTLSTNVAFSAKMYKWVDAQGRISYQDQPPPKNSKILSEKELKNKNTSPLKTFTSNKNPIDVYVTQSCSACDVVISSLEKWAVPHQVKRIEDHREIQTRLVQETAAVKVPALFSDGTLIINTNTTDSLKASLIATGHVEPEVEVAPEGENKPETDNQPENKTDADVNKEAEGSTK